MIACRLDTPAVDIPSFLRTYPPFDELTDDRLSTVVEHTHIEFYGRDQIILQAGGDPAQFLYVVRTGAVELVDEEQVLDLLSEGEVFGHPGLFVADGSLYPCSPGIPPSLTIAALAERQAVLLQ